MGMGMGMGSAADKSHEDKRPSAVFPFLSSHLPFCPLSITYLYLHQLHPQSQGLFCELVKIAI